MAKNPSDLKPAGSNNLLLLSEDMSPDGSDWSVDSDTEGKFSTEPPRNKEMSSREETSLYAIPRHRKRRSSIAPDEKTIRPLYD